MQSFCTSVVNIVGVEQAIQIFHILEVTLLNCFSIVFNITKSDIF